MTKEEALADAKKSHDNKVLEAQLDVLRGNMSPTLLGDTLCELDYQYLQEKKAINRRYRFLWLKRLIMKWLK